MHGAGPLAVLELVKLKSSFGCSMWINILFDQEFLECGYRRSLQPFVQEDIHNLDAVVQNHKRALDQVNSRLQQLEQQPVTASVASSSNTSDCLNALEIDVGALKDDVQSQQFAAQQLEQRICVVAANPSSAPRETTPKSDGQEIFCDSTKTDPTSWFCKFELTLQLHHVSEHKHHAYLYSRSGGACQAWLDNLLSKYAVVAAELHTKINWDDLKAAWHKRFQVEPPEIEVMDKLMTFEQGSLPTTPVLKPPMREHAGAHRQIASHCEWSEEQMLKEVIKYIHISLKEEVGGLVRRAGSSWRKFYDDMWNKYWLGGDDSFPDGVTLVRRCNRMLSFTGLAAKVRTLEDVKAVCSREDTRTGTSTSPYTAEQEAKAAAILKETREKEAKKKALLEAQAAKLKRIEEEMAKEKERLKKEQEEKLKAVEEEEEEEEEQPLEMRRAGRRGESSGRKEDLMEKKITEWVAGLSLGEDEEALMYVPRDEQEAAVKEWEAEGDPLKRQVLEDEKRMEWKFRLTRERKRRMEAASHSAIELEEIKKQKDQMAVQVDLLGKMEIMAKNIERLARVQEEQLLFGRSQDIVVRSIRSGLRDFARELATQVGSEVKARLDNTECYCTGAIKGARLTAPKEEEARPRREPVKVKFPDSYSGKKEENFDNWEANIKTYVHLQKVSPDEHVLVAIHALKKEAASFARSLVRAANCNEDVVAYSAFTPLADFLKLLRERFVDVSRSVRASDRLQTIHSRQWRSAKALKGVMDDYISHRALKKLRLNSKVQKLEDPIVSVLADNRTMRVEEYVEGVQAYFRLEKDGKVEKVLHSLTLLVQDDLPFDIVLGMDWGEAAGTTLHLREHECRLPSPAGEVKTVRLFHVSGVDNTLAHCCLSAPAFARMVKKENLEEQVFVVYVRPVTEPKEEKPVDPAIAKLLEEFKDLPEPPTIVVPRPIQHCIEIEPGSKTPKGAVYRMSPWELEELRKQLDELLEKGWIRPSSSPFGAPVLFVPKKEGEFRMCIDYRGLNAITVKNAEPLPRIDDLLDRMQGRKYFSRIDLKSGYHQIEVHPDDQYKTAFRTRYGHYEFIIMPFGLTNAPATFQRCMNDLFRPWLDRFVVVYLDDILIFSKTLQEHQGHLRQVLEKLREANFKINPKKCEWAKTQVLYLGHVLDGDGIKPEDRKIAAIRDWPTPRTLTELRSFLGLANYYRKFVRNFFTIVAPLRRLLRKETIWKWDKDCTSAMKKLKQALIEYPVLKVADPSLPLVVTTDASQYGIGVVLQQDDGNGYRLVEFMSARMPSEKVATSTYERELYALRQALEHWKHYLLGRHFKVYSDHETLRWLKTQAKMTPKLTRWAAEIDQYDFELKPVKGKYNVVADAPSRRSDYFGAIVHYLDIGKDLQQKVREAYAQDPIYSDLRKKVMEAPETEPDYRTIEGLLFEKTNVVDRLCIPNSEEIRSLILGECHDTEGHFGWQKTSANLIRAYTWPGMKNDCIEYVRSCKVCLRNKTTTRAPLGLLRPLPIPDQPGDSVSIDFMDTGVKSRHSKSQVMVIVDRFSKTSVFVAAAEQGLGHDLPGIIRRPKSTEDREQNCDIVVKEMGSQFHYDLSHISANRIVQGSLVDIRDLVDIIIGCFPLSSGAATPHLPRSRNDHPTGSDEKPALRLNGGKRGKDNEPGRATAVLAAVQRQIDGDPNSARTDPLGGAHDSQSALETSRSAPAQESHSLVLDGGARRTRKTSKARPFPTCQNAASFNDDGAGSARGARSDPHGDPRHRPLLHDGPLAEMPEGPRTDPRGTSQKIPYPLSMDHDPTGTVEGSQGSPPGTVLPSPIADAIAMEIVNDLLTSLAGDVRSSPSVDDDSGVPKDSREDPPLETTHDPIALHHGPAGTAEGPQRDPSSSLHGRPLPVDGEVSQGFEAERPQTVQNPPADDDTGSTLQGLMDDAAGATHDSISLDDVPAGTAEGAKSDPPAFLQDSPPGPISEPGPLSGVHDSPSLAQDSLVVPEGPERDRLAPSAKPVHAQDDKVVPSEGGISDAKPAGVKGTSRGSGRTSNTKPADVKGTPRGFHAGVRVRVYPSPRPQDSPSLIQGSLVVPEGSERDSRAASNVLSSQNPEHAPSAKPDHAQDDKLVPSERGISNAKPADMKVTPRGSGRTSDSKPADVKSTTTSPRGFHAGVRVYPSPRVQTSSPAALYSPVKLLELISVESSQGQGQGVEQSKSDVAGKQEMTEDGTAMLSPRGLSTSRSEAGAGEQEKAVPGGEVGESEKEKKTDIDVMNDDVSATELDALVGEVSALESADAAGEDDAVSARELDVLVEEVSALDSGAGDEGKEKGDAGMKNGASAGDIRKQGKGVRQARGPTAKTKKPRIAKKKEGQEERAVGMTKGELRKDTVEGVEKEATEGAGYVSSTGSPVGRAKKRRMTKQKKEEWETPRMAKDDGSTAAMGVVQGMPKVVKQVPDEAVSANPSEPLTSRTRTKKKKKKEGEEGARAVKDDGATTEMTVEEIAEEVQETLGDLDSMGTSVGIPTKKRRKVKKKSEEGDGGSTARDSGWVTQAQTERNRGRGKEVHQGEGYVESRGTSVAKTRKRRKLKREGVKGGAVLKEDGWATDVTAERGGEETERTKDGNFPGPGARVSNSAGPKVSKFAGGKGFNFAGRKVPKKFSNVRALRRALKKREPTKTPRSPAKSKRSFRTEGAGSGQGGNQGAESLAGEQQQLQTRSRHEDRNQDPNWAQELKWGDEVLWKAGVQLQKDEWVPEDNRVNEMRWGEELEWKEKDGWHREIRQWTWEIEKPNESPHKLEKGGGVHVQELTSEGNMGQVDMGNSESGVQEGAADGKKAAANGEPHARSVSVRRTFMRKQYRIRGSTGHRVLMLRSVYAQPLVPPPYRTDHRTQYLIKRPLLHPKKNGVEHDVMVGLKTAQHMGWGRFPSMLSKKWRRNDKGKKRLGKSTRVQTLNIEDEEGTSSSPRRNSNGEVETRDVEIIHIDSQVNSTGMGQPSSHSDAGSYSNANANVSEIGEGNSSSAGRVEDGGSEPQSDSEAQEKVQRSASADAGAAGVSATRSANGAVPAQIPNGIDGATTDNSNGHFQQYGAERPEGPIPAIGHRAGSLRDIQTIRAGDGDNSAAPDGAHHTANEGKETEGEGMAGESIGNEKQASDRPKEEGKEEEEEEEWDAEDSEEEEEREPDTLEKWVLVRPRPGMGNPFSLTSNSSWLTWAKKGIFTVGDLWDPSTEDWITTDQLQRRLKYASATSATVPHQQQCHVSSATLATVPRQQQCHVSSATVPRQQCPATMTGSVLGMPGQLANESIAEYRQRFEAQLALIEAEKQRQAAAEAAHLQAEAAATAEKQRLQAKAEADTQARHKEAQDLLQRHEATSIEKLKFSHFEI
ncbi:hypothetical protein CBR_g11920 [Chara braunii]|uniref:Reverse transcriptase domain-containing protein n=1 Tax=Chara braunii TaxID=69332 RepID=A0A388KQM9_CHABU|nr:hypothetical protein CBR_g11920 [Chara braunii]|eukprot:GBG72342.1 hypothetical protein CBR_g11920 [Chara braunii]